LCENELSGEHFMLDVYSPCPCGSGKNFKFCCYQSYKKGDFEKIIKRASHLPIYECKAFDKWEETGMTPVTIARALNQETYVLVSYLVDSWCLGLKDVLIKIGMSAFELSHYYEMTSQDQSLISISYQDARSLILGAIDYAKNLGIEPYDDWKKVESFVEGNHSYENKFSFGKDGKPFYYAGPYDLNKYNIEDIIDKVTAAGGHYILPLIEDFD
jgi:hypothetical protein